MATIIGKSDSFETLSGTSAGDILIGGAGENELIGRAGSDVFKASTRVSTQDSYDTILDFRQGIDKIDVSSYGISSFDQLKAILTPANSDPNDAYFNAYWDGRSHAWQIVGINADDLKATDFKFSTLTGRTVEGTDSNDYGVDDRLFGTKGNDVLKGYAGDDQIFGGNGNDTLIGGNDQNKLSGGAGADIFAGTTRVQGKESFDTIMDFRQGTDKIDVSSYGISSFDQLRAILTAAESDPNDAYFNANWGGYSHSWQIVGVSADSLKASDFKFSTLTGRTIDGTNVNDYGPEDRVFGTTGNDTLRGNAGDDQLFGGNGNDTLIGGNDDNALWGGVGADVFTSVARVAGWDSSDTIMDFRQGTDKIDVSAYGISSFDQLKAILTAAKSDPNDAYFNAHWGGYSHEWQIVGINADSLKASDFKFSTLTGRTIDGTNVNDYGPEDRVFGTTGNDIVRGNAGDDQLFGGNGNDTLIGGNDDNALWGGVGADVFTSVARVAGWDSSDTIMDFRQGTDKIDVSAYGISSFDQLKAILTAAKSDPNDAYFNAYWGGYSHEWQIVGISADSLKASDFKFSTLTGRAIDGTNVNDYGVEDRLFGTAGNDVMKGYAGDDQLFGGNGNDTLIGGANNDGLFGGKGQDKFVFNSSLSANNNVDRIADFVAKDDVIQLENSIFTKLTKTGTLSANFFAANTTGKATDGLDRIIYETDTGKLFYDADGSGSLKAIQFGLLETKPTISHFDFFVI